MCVVAQNRGVRYPPRVAIIEYPLKKLKRGMVIMKNDRQQRTVTMKPISVEKAMIQYDIECSGQDDDLYYNVDQVRSKIVDISSVCSFRASISKAARIMVNGEWYAREPDILARIIKARGTTASEFIELIGRDVVEGIASTCCVNEQPSNSASASGTKSWTKAYAKNSTDISTDTVTINKHQSGDYRIVSFSVSRGNGKHDTYLRGYEFTEFMGYSDGKETLERRVDRSNKIFFAELLKFPSVKEYYRKQRLALPRTNAVFISLSAVTEILIRSRKPESIKLAALLNINVHQKFLMKETDIVSELDKFFTAANIRFEHQYLVGNKTGLHYVIDYYLPDYKLAIEIDERNHIGRDPVYEIERETHIRDKLGCEFIRCNPDSSKFSVAGLIGIIYTAIHPSAHKQPVPITTSNTTPKESRKQQQTSEMTELRVLHGQARTSHNKFYRMARIIEAQR